MVASKTINSTDWPEFRPIRGIIRFAKNIEDFLRYIEGEVNMGCQEKIRKRVVSAEKIPRKIRLRKWKGLVKMEKVYNKFVIIFWSPYEWEKIWRRPMIKALARNLQDIGKILYICTPFSPFVTFFLNRDRYKRTINKPHLEKITDNLIIYKPRAILNQYIVDKFKIQKRYNKRIDQKVNKALQSLGWSDHRRISWINFPYQINQINVVHESFVVYECLDEYRSFSKDKKTNASVSALEDRLFKRVNIVLTTSEPLYKSRKKMHPNVFLTPNGVAFELFRKTNNSKLRTPEDMTHIPHPIIGFVGMIRNWLDFDLLNYISEKRPDWSLIFVGPHTKNDREVRRFVSNGKPNIYFLGEKKHESIPAYLDKFDVAIIPFKTNDLGNAINPLKLWEYLATGKPVVSTKLKALQSYRDALFLASSGEELVNCTEEILRNSQSKHLEEKLRIGVELASRHSWNSITEEVANILLRTLS